MTPKQFSALGLQLNDCVIKDRIKLSNKIKRLTQFMRQGRLRTDAWQNLEQQVLVARQHCSNRRSSVPAIDYPSSLPISGKSTEIAQCIANNQVTIIAGETGSGKTTQIPKICLKLGRGVKGMIAHTQPRRMAARVVAQRIAAELGSELGVYVGYKVRFSERTSEQLYVKLMTDGILLAELQHDRLLNQYDTLIIDEAHERSLNIDFLLGYCKYLLPQRPDLKLIITSATIDVERFSKHFDHAPVLKISGRSYPVEVRYRPLFKEQEQEHKQGSGQQDVTEGIVQAITEIKPAQRGDVLVFLSGEREIRDTAEALRKAKLAAHQADVEILPLYARLSVKEQARVFQSHRGLRIVLATNVAETSLTIPGIRMVVDTGLARVNRYSHRTKIQRLQIEKIAQASANQRAGRCGRIGPGICVRLYSEEDFHSRPEYLDAEILRSNLAAVILNMQFMGLGDVAQFPFIDRPDPRFIKDGYQLLLELGALTPTAKPKTAEQSGTAKLTPIGQQLARLPVDPRIGRMIIASAQQNCLEQILTLAAVLSIQDPRERPAEQSAKADQLHRQYVDPRSDFSTLLNLWDTLQKAKLDLSRKNFQQYCYDHFLSYVRVREWSEIRRQLRSSVLEFGFTFNKEPAEYWQIHQALLSGLLSFIGFKQAGVIYCGARNSRFYLFPGAATYKKPPKWLMSAEIVETSKRYARMTAKIEPNWLEPLADHLIRRSYQEPHWEKHQAQVMAVEKLSLFGLVIHPGRKVPYGQIDPVLSRDLLIRHGLLYGELPGAEYDFYRHNRQLIDCLAALEEKTRSRTILVDEQVIEDFYQGQLPADIVNGAGFARWYKKARLLQPKCLYLQEKTLIKTEELPSLDHPYPDYLELGDNRLKLNYCFEPGHEMDGVTVDIPLSTLPQLSPTDFELLVPGLLPDKIVALIRLLPKALRRHFVPVPTFAQACCEYLLSEFSNGELPLTTLLSTKLQKMTGIHIDTENWRLTDLPPHLQMRFRVFDKNNKTQGQSRDLSALATQLKKHSSEVLIDWAGANFQQKNLTHWSFGDLPTTIERNEGQLILKAYPALVDRGQSVDLKVFDNPAKARQAMFAGCSRLLFLQLQKEVKHLPKQIAHWSTTRLLAGKLGGEGSLLDDICIAAVGLHLAGDLEMQTQQQFQTTLDSIRPQFSPSAMDLGKLVGNILAQSQQITLALEAKHGKSPKVDFAADIAQQLSQLIFPGFVRQVPAMWLNRYPKYLSAIEVRLEKLTRNPGKDIENMDLMDPYLHNLAHCFATFSKGLTAAPQAVSDYRWILEELRISLFAQSIKTHMPVSVQRLRKKWLEIERQQLIPLANIQEAVGSKRQSWGR